MVAVSARSTRQEDQSPGVIVDRTSGGGGRPVREDRALTTQRVGGLQELRYTE